MRLRPPRLRRPCQNGAVSTDPAAAAATDRSPSIDDWAGPGKGARAVAVALAIVIAVVIFFVVNRVWHIGAPAAATPKPASVEVQLVQPPAPAPSAPGR